MNEHDFLRGSIIHKYVLKPVNITNTLNIGNTPNSQLTDIIEQSSFNKYDL